MHGAFARVLGGLVTAVGILRIIHARHCAAMVVHTVSAIPAVGDARQRIGFARRCRPALYNTAFLRRLPCGFFHYRLLGIVENDPFISRTAFAFFVLVRIFVLFNRT